MPTRRILTVEDHHPMVALDLKGIVLGASEAAQVAVAYAVVEARDALAALKFDAAFLDVEMLDGKTFEIAPSLHERGTPFAFVSEARPEEVPPPPRHITSLTKPYYSEGVEHILFARLSR